MNTINQSGNDYFQIGALRLKPDLSGALYAPDHKVLIVADLHFEKASTLYEKSGSAFPPYDTQDTLSRLRKVIDCHRPERIIFLGDTWHDKFGFVRMQDGDQQSIKDLIKHHDAVFIAGNHDEIVSGTNSPKLISEIKLSDVILRHEPCDDQNSFQICGHLHPVARLIQKGRVIRRRCFLISDKQCILPAMGALTGGLNCLDPAFDRVLSPIARRVILLGRNRLYHIGMNSLSPD